MIVYFLRRPPLKGILSSKSQQSFKTFSGLILFVFLLSFSFTHPLVAQVGGPNGSGAWSPVYNMPIVPVAMANLPDGKVLCWSALDRDGYGQGGNRTYTSVYDPANNSFTDVLVTNVGHDMFCPGTNNLPDGRILVAGGRNSELTSIYNWQTESWESGPTMKIPRGYQGNATLSDGSLFSIGGSWSGGRGNKDGEVFTLNDGWRILSNVTAAETVEEGTTGYSDEGVYRTDNHAWVFEAPNGRVFHAGPGERMHWIDVAGNGNVEDVGVRGTDQYSMNGNATMYDIGKILKVGGAPSYSSGHVSNDRAYIIDINGNTPVVTRVDDLTYNRTMVTSVVLPTGEVLVVGGLRDAEIFTDANSRLVPELWDPATGNFRNLAPMDVPRTYHSAGILLDDGRVLVGGGGLCNNCSVNHPDAQVFTPPYLLNSDGTPATRPQISNAPQTADNNANITVNTNTSINQFSLIRLGSATHSVNNEQRRVPLNFTASGTNTYSLSIPSASIAIPGYYMLFAIKNGVPSVSKAIRIGDIGNSPDPTVQLPYPQQTSNIPGTIQAEFYDLGGQGVAYNDDNSRDGDNFRSSDNVDVEILSGNNYNIGWTAENEWVEYTLDVTAGTYDVTLRASSGYSGTGPVGDVSVSLDGQTIGTFDVNKTGSWANYTNITVPNVTLSGGSNKVLRLTVINGERLNIDQITFSPSGSSCTPGTACDDGDANTINDTYNSSCNCVGTPIGSGQTNFWLEAECGEVGSAWNLINESAASGGQALSYTGGSSTGSAPTSAADRVRFTIDVEQAGSYEVYVRSIAPNSSSDSYWVRANNGSWVRYNFVNAPSYPTSYSWDQVGDWISGSDNTPVSFNLSVGNNTIDFAYRENDIKFDKAFVTLNQGQPSGSGSTAENCSPSCTPGTACDDGDACTSGDVYDSNCDCVGTIVDSDNDGVCNAEDVCPSFNDNLIGTACDDGDPSTIGDTWNSNCECEGNVTGQTRYVLQTGNIPGTIEGEHYDNGGQGIAFNESNITKKGSSSIRPGDPVDMSTIPSGGVSLQVGLPKENGSNIPLTQLLGLMT